MESGKFIINSKGFAVYKAGGAGAQTASEEPSGGDSGYGKVSQYTGTLDRDDFIP